MLSNNFVVILMTLLFTKGYCNTVAMQLLWLIVIIDAESLTQDSCTQHGAVRLVGTPQNLRSQGRVEICIGSSWGTICRDNWDNYDAEVVCNQLGYGRDGNLIDSQTYEP